MPYCSQCGNAVEGADVFCGKCGSRQPSTPRPYADPLAGMTARTAAILCYIPVVGWIASIVVLAAEKFRNNRTVRFHAFQGLYLFVAWLIVNQVFRPIWHSLEDPGMPVDRILEAILMAAWIIMLIKTRH